MTILWIILAACVGSACVGSAFLAFLWARAIRVSHNPHSLAAATPTPPAAVEGTGAHPDGVGHGNSPCAAVPPQGVPRPSRRRMAEQIEVTGYYGEKLQ